MSTRPQAPQKPKGSIASPVTLGVPHDEGHSTCFLYGRKKELYILRIEAVILK